jgi:hypothetical protein
MWSKADSWDNRYSCKLSLVNCHNTKYGPEGFALARLTLERRLLFFAVQQISLRIY